MPVQVGTEAKTVNPHEANAMHREMAMSIMQVERDVEAKYKSSNSDGSHLIHDLVTLSNYMSVLATMPVQHVVPIYKHLMLAGMRVAVKDWKECVPENSDLFKPLTATEQEAVAFMIGKYDPIIKRHSLFLIGATKLPEISLLPLSFIMGALRNGQSPRAHIEVCRAVLWFFLLKALIYVGHHVSLIEKLTPTRPASQLSEDVLKQFGAAPAA